MAAGLIVAGARAAGDLVAAQAGLSTTTLFDPESGEELTPLGRLYGLVAMAAFLSLGGPLALVRALGDSYAAIPAGQLGISRPTATFAFGQAGRALELALRAAAPAAIALIMAGIALAWLSRTAPSLPFLVLALPIRARPRYRPGPPRPRGPGGDPRGSLGSVARASVDNPNHFGG